MWVSFRKKRKYYSNCFNHLDVAASISCFLVILKVFDAIKIWTILDCGCEKTKQIVIYKLGSCESLPGEFEIYLLCTSFQNDGNCTEQHLMQQVISGY